MPKVGMVTESTNPGPLMLELSTDPMGKGTPTHENHEIDTKLSRKEGAEILSARPAIIVGSLDEG
ncbi:hypothetical protein N7474_008624 [Penicillium riverlandense]|uniref:uncharacterized protein n=1 Tax=Penicillium riverlandense TaxID=1903569 RepID=UPI0025476947|nr:uncharacterized protein N7474_008624 [Penicillium riverlandense]KAJ5812323.1 hypothetical protein N7474_008624 [Penicillium riverlandense]